MARVIVVGGGVAGMAVAFTLRWRQTELPGGLDLSVMEARAGAGGSVSTERLDGAAVEAGPESFPANSPWTLALIQRLGLAPSLLRGALAASAAQVYSGGAIRQVPASPRALLQWPDLSPAARLRVLREPMVRPGPEGVSETVGAFFRRRLGDQAGQLIASALAADRFGADPDLLGMDAAFPEVAKRVAEAGSLFKAGVLGELAAADAATGERQRGFKLVDEVVGLMAANTAEAGMRRFQGGAFGSMGSEPMSLAGGMGALPASLAQALGDRIHLGHALVAVEGAEGRSSGPYRLRLQGPDGEREHVAEGVCLALPADVAAAALRPLDPELAATLGAIPLADVTEVLLGWDAGACPELPGRGYAVATGGGVRHFRASWTHRLFPQEEAPTRRWARFFFGGMGDPGVHDLDEGALTSLAIEEASRTVGGPPPAAVRVRRRAARIPTYLPSHASLLAAIERRLTLHPGLVLAGQSYRGPELSEVLRDVGAVGDRLISALRHGEGRTSGAPHPRRG